MRLPLRRPSRCSAAIFVLCLGTFGVDLRGQAVKRPLTYDMYDAWKSIQGTTLSRDGRWLAYAVTARGLTAS